MRFRESVRFLMWITLTASVVGLIANYMSNTNGYVTTQAQSVLPTITPTPAPRGSIGDTVWQDDDGDGMQDPGEPGIPGVTVSRNGPGDDGICGTADDEVQFFYSSSDGNGRYLYEYLLEGVYCMDPDETTVPAGYALTTANDPQTVDLGPGEDFLDADFGYQPPPAPWGSIGDTVWYDNDGDGVQDAGEPGIPAVTVNLTDCAGVLVASDGTAADGLYLFDGLDAGTFCVEIDETTLPDDVQQSYEKDGTLDGNTEQPLSAGDEVLDVDFGYQPLVCSDAAPSIATLWPPNHGFVAINVLGVHGVQGDPIAITIDSILQDEPVHAPGSGSTSPDGRGVGTATAKVRAERDGGANGRVYHITFTAHDGHGGTCSGEVLVGVPQSETHAAVDDGPLYNSTVVMP